MTGSRYGLQDAKRKGLLRSPKVPRRKEQATSAEGKLFWGSLHCPLEEPLRRRREELVLKFLPLVKKMALQMRERLPLHVEVDDLVSEGSLGLLDAIRKFDTSKNAKLQTYARQRIRGAMLDGLRSLDHASRDSRKKERKAETVYRELQMRLGRSPDDQEIADRLGISLNEWYRTVRELAPIGLTWLVAVSSDGLKQFMEPDKVTLPPARSGNQFDQCYRREQRDLLSSALQQLPDREREIIESYYFRGHTLEQIGRKLGIDSSRVSQLHSAALARLRSQITAMLRYHPGRARPSGLMIADSYLEM